MHKPAAAFALISLALVAFSPAAEAKPFSAKRVPDGAEGVIHVDLDKLRGSRLWGLVEAKSGIGSLEKAVRDEAPAEWSKADVDLAVEAVETAQSLTFWVDANESGAMLVQLPNAAKVADRITKLASARTIKRRGVVLYRLPEEDGKGDEGYGAREGDTLILGDKPEAVVKTVLVLRGKAKSLAPSRLGASTSAGDLFLIAGFRGQIMKALRDSAQASSLGADIRSVAVHAGETKSEVILTARIETDSAATATKLASVASGLSALVTLAGDEPELAALVQGLSVTSKGSTVNARLAVSHATLSKLLTE